MATNELDLLKQTIDRSNEQGQVIAKIVTELQNMKSDMEELYTDIKEEFEEFKKTIPLSGPEADKLQGLAHQKAYELTNYYLGKQVSEELFSAKYGHLIRGVYKSIKEKFAVAKYNQVRHREAVLAFEYVQQMTLDSLDFRYLRMTDRQLEIAAKHKDEIPHDFRGAHINYLKFYEFSSQE